MEKDNIFPARAGMIPGTHRTKDLLNNIPRASGDDPFAKFFF